MTTSNQLHELPSHFWEDDNNALNELPKEFWEDGYDDYGLDVFSFNRDIKAKRELRVHKCSCDMCADGIPEYCMGGRNRF